MAERTSVLLTPPPYRSAAWHEWRTHGLGASEFPALVGADPYRTEYGLALIKRRLAEDDADNAATRWGKRIEEVALDAYAEMYGDITRGETWGDSRWPHLWATLDGRRGRIGVEVKASMRWANPPPKVRIQALGQMGLADLDAVDIVRVSPYGEPQVTTLARNDEGNEQAIADLLALGEAWYLRYCEGDEMPPVDGSPLAMRHLDTFRGEDAMEADADQQALALAMRHVRAELAKLTEQDSRLVAQMKASMAGAKALTGSGFKVTWSAVKGRVTVGWEGVAKAYEALLLHREPGLAAELDTLRDLHTTVGEPGTRFAVKFEETEEEQG